MDGEEETYGEEVEAKAVARRLELGSDLKVLGKLSRRVSFLCGRFAQMTEILGSFP